MDSAPTIWLWFWEIIFFLSQGIKLNQRDRRGRAMLHYITIQSDHAMMKLLIKKGVSIDIMSENSQETALSLAKEAIDNYYTSKNPKVAINDKGFEHIEFGAI